MENVRGLGSRRDIAARGSSNAKAKRELGWAPRYGTWREGFQEWAKSAE